MIIRLRLVAILFSIFPATASAQPAPTWRLQLIHAIRPADGTPGMLGNVQGLAIFADGSVAVAEVHPARVVRFGTDGLFVRTLMGDGEGPAEGRRPTIAAHGDTLAVYDGVLSRLTRITSGGRVLEERLVNAAPEGAIWAPDDGSIFLQIVNTPDPWTGGALRLRAGRTDTVYWRRPPADELVIQWHGPSWDLVGRSPFSPRGVSTFDPAGRLVIGGSRQSRWAVVAGKDTLRTVALPEHPVPIATRVRDSVWKAWYSQLPPKNLPHLAEVVRKERIPTTLPPWVTFNIDQRGAWWVGRPGPDGVLASWDVVVDGKVAGHVPVPARVVDVFPMGPVMTFGNGVVALLHEDPLGVPWIGVYRVVGNGR